MERIYLVEDDPVIARLVCGELEKWGYEVRCPSDFDHVMEEFAACDPQLVLMDVILPRFNGFHWCQEIRRVSKVPVMFLSSASDNMSIVMAINMGGDDFVSKPFDLAVLTAKVQALMRRTYDFGAPGHLLPCGSGTLDVSAGVVRHGESSVELTRNESRMMQTLLARRGAVVSRSELMARLWESDDFVDENTLTVNIARLRRKLDEVGLTELIRTKKGEGYWVE